MIEKRVLVVDDDPVVGRATLRILKKKTESVELISRPQLAFETVAANPDVDWFIVTDKDMKSGSQGDALSDGIELAKAIRSLLLKFQIYIVLATGNIHYVELAEAQEHPFDAILTKPYEAQALWTQYDIFAR